MATLIERMYEEAAGNCRTEDGSYFYDGYKGGNALSMYVYKKYGVNAADETAANEALKSAL